MESEKGTEVVQNKDLNAYIEATKNGSGGGGDPLSKSLSSSSSSSSSSLSSSNRLKQLDLGEKEGVDNPEWSMVSSSPRTGTGPPKLSPPIQTMSRPDDYDPNRIPSSVFHAQNNAAMEWSVTSNESLFSIQIGNSSFSREQMLLTKSGELTNSVSGNDLSAPRPLPTVDEEGDCETPKMGHAKKDSGSGKNLKKKDSLSGDNLKKQEKVVVINETPPSTFASPPLTTPSRLSDDSSKSFAFPVLANEGSSAKPLQETSHTIGQVKAKSKPGQKHEPEPNPEPSHHHQHQTDAETSHTRKKWFPCFSCCPYCC